MIEEVQQISLAPFGEPWPPSPKTRQISSPSWIAHQVRCSNLFKLNAGQPDQYSLQLIDFMNVVWRNCPLVAQ